MLSYRTVARSFATFLTAEREYLAGRGQVGFTRLSTTMSALRAVRLLNDVFSRVEAAAARLGSFWKVRRRAPFIQSLAADAACLLDKGVP